MRNFLPPLMLLLAVAAFHWPVKCPVIDGDHTSFVSERTYYVSSSDYLKAAPFFNRNRHTKPGDYYLFRPLFHEILAMEEVLLGKHPQAILWVSLLFHAIAVLSLYLFFLPRWGWKAALTAGIIFASHPASSRVVEHVHLVPYALGLGCFALSLVTRRQWLSALLLAAACLIHEAFVAAAMLVWIGHALFRSRIPRPPAYVGVVSLIWLAANFTDLALRGLAPISPSGGAGSLAGKALFALAFVPGYQLASGVLPLLSTSSFWPAVIFSFPLTVAIVLGVLKNRSKEDFARSLILCALISEWSLLAVGRGAGSGYDYLRHASHHTYIGIYLMMLLAATYPRERFLFHSKAARVAFYLILLHIPLVGFITRYQKWHHDREKLCRSVND